MYSLILIFVLILAGSSWFIGNNQDSFEPITLENAHKLVEIRTWTDTNGSFYPVAAFSPDGSELAIALNNGQVEIVSMQTMQTDHIIEGIETEAYHLTYSSDGTELLLSKYTGIYTLIDVENGEILASNTVVDEDNMFSHTPDVRKYVRWNSREHGLSIHDTLTGDRLLSVEDIYLWQISYDGKLLLTRNLDFIVEIWDIEMGEIIFTIFPPNENLLPDILNEAGFTPEGLIWVTYPQYMEVNDRIVWSNPIHLWDISTGEIVLELGAGYSQYRAITSLVFDPTNTYALAYVLSDRGFQVCSIWNLSTQAELQCPAGGNYSGVFSADGRIIATYSGTAPGVEIRPVEPPGRPIAVLDTENTRFARFTPDGRFLVTIGQSIHLWGIP